MAGSMSKNPDQKGKKVIDRFASIDIAGNSSHLKGNECEEGCSEKQVGTSVRLVDDDEDEEIRILPPSILDPTDKDEPVGRIYYSVESPPSKKKVDFLAKAAEMGITFPPPRWWRPGGYGPESLENERRKKNDVDSRDSRDSRD